MGWPQVFSPFFVLLYETKFTPAGAFVFAFPDAGVYPSLLSCMNPILPAAGAFVFVFMEHNPRTAGDFPFVALLYQTNPPGRM